MAGRAPYSRGAGVFLALSGGLLLVHDPGFTAPAKSRPAKSAQRAAPMPVKPPSAPRPSLPGRVPAPVVDQDKVPGVPALPPPGNEIMRVAEVKPGMKGYGLTVFRGTTIERFNVEVVGVMPKSNLGQPLVLVRLSGGPITGRGAYLIQGMSGSPVYINGKLLGAFAMGNAW